MRKSNVPDTSKEALNSLDPSKLRETYRNILYALSQLGEATTEECAAYLKTDHSKLWKRYSELHQMKLIYRPGNKRLLKSGRNGFTWRLTSNALPTTTAAEKALKGKSVSDYSKEITKISQQTVKQQNLF